ncbi:hypothetical protein IMSHALPRED_009205 [Imshaugia aleurites]|uniref:Uncharacterized protein n=1 Tax=Imshaugia aleurites TaxID=172621 RepID=A0A8H3I7P5_9LECA|nr:hypothetical protein IMSHALPRED_009205 [Imshaugia aleurites]
MQDTPRIAPISIPHPSNALLAPLFALAVGEVEEAVPSDAVDEVLPVSVAIAEPLDEAVPAGAAVAAAPPLLTPASLNTPASTNFVHAPTISAE